MRGVVLLMLVAVLSLSTTAVASAAAGPTSKSDVRELERTVEEAERSTAGRSQPSLGAPGIDPPGANNFNCRPSDEHPFPVVLVHGTFGDMTISWNLISPRLKKSGYCVFALDYGNRGTDRIQNSAQQLEDFVDRVRDATGADKVQIVGHSQGGMMPRHYIKFLDGDGEVEDLVGLSPSNHGTTNPFAGPAGLLGCKACRQQARGSEFLRQLNSGDETPGPVDYTQVQTRFDEVVTPYQSAFLEPGPRSTNVLLQDTCPDDRSEHNSIIYDRNALRWIKNALGREGPADPGFRPRCS